MLMSGKDLEIIRNSIRTIEDYPHEGISFKDITTLLNNKEAFSVLMDSLVKRYKSYELDYIAGIESRGFIFGSALAHRLGLGFVPIRKKGKLPYTTVSEKYALEYGFDEVEIHIDAFAKNSNVLLIDDLIATGGTAKASCNLINKVGAKCVEACFILNLKELNGDKAIKELTTVFSVLEI